MSLPRFRLVQGKALGERSGPPPPLQQQPPQQIHQQQQPVNNMPPESMPQVKVEVDLMQDIPSQQEQQQHVMHQIKQEQQQNVMHQIKQEQQQQNVMHQIKQEDPISPPRNQMMGAPQPPPQMMQQRGPPSQQMPHFVQQPQHPQMMNQAPMTPQNPANQPQNPNSEDKNVQKCVRFLKTLISLSQNEDPEMPDKALRVSNLIQGVIYMETTAEQFTRDLQEVLRSQAQPHLLPFLQNTLPALRNAVRNGTASVEGVNPPPGYVFNNGRHPQQQNAPPTPQAPPQQQQQQMTPQAAPHDMRGPPMNPPMNQGVPINQAGPQGGPAGPGPQQMMNRMNVDNGTPQGRPNFQQRPPGPPLQSTPVVRTISGGPMGHPQGPGPHQGPPPSHQQQPHPQMPPQSQPPRTPQSVSSQGPQPMEVDGSPAPPPPRRQYPEGSLKSAILKHDEILNRITKRMMAPCQVEEDALIAISDAVESHLREMITMMAGFAEHRVESQRIPENYVPVDDVKRQLKFLEELDRQEEEMRENREKDALIRASKNKNIGKETIEKAKEMQRQDAEAKRNRDANAAAIAAWEGAASTSTAPRPRTVRVTARDLQMLVNQDNRFTGTFIREKLSYGGPTIDPTI
ncbi:hypothetical protein B9Z55_000551 [Caenorhabditis nigoni]|uniref:TAFH domain-containing protein n=1 Tax=Caenorhabditis nigoni TaxID=1611254 RepID=A0A2G5VU11_9PELO|nr:hypothetical protein B9Z55_000551 [Caenorhabditis nigoni]